MTKERQSYEYNNEIEDLKAKNEVLRQAFAEMSAGIKRLTESLYNAKFGAHKLSNQAATYKAALTMYAASSGDDGHEARVALGQVCRTCDIQNAMPQVTCFRRETMRLPSCKHWKLYEGAPVDGAQN